MLAAGMLNMLALRFASELNLVPFLQSRVMPIQQARQKEQESYMRDSMKDRKSTRLNSSH